ncbi:MAG: sulfite exporter TauE/SafE family protein [Pseudomonadota bacterium]
MPELIDFAVILAATGALAGLIGGLMGVGGGFVIVPILYNILPALGVSQSVAMSMAVATSLATIAFTSAVAGLLRGPASIASSPSLRLALPAGAGAVVGGALAGTLDARMLTLLFATTAFLVAFYLTLLRAMVWADAPVGGTSRAIAGGLLGAVGVLTGTAGRALGIPLLTLMGVGQSEAMATMARLAVFIAVPGSIAFIVVGAGDPRVPPGSLGYVNLLGVSIMAPVALLFLAVGERLARSVPPTFLSVAFALYLIAVGARMVTSL